MMMGFQPATKQPRLVWGGCLLVLSLLLAGCASMGNTLAQDLAWERWKKCDRFPGITLKEIRADGQIWYWNLDAYAQVGPFNECLRQAAAEQAARRATVVAAPAPVVPVPPQGASQQPTIASAPPMWKVGDEWAYRWESPRGKGTFVWSVAREEIVDGVEFYVVTSPQRESFYRKGDVAFSFEKFEGAVETRHVPPSMIAWPLVPGKTWEQRYVRERPGERQTEEMLLACEVGPEENLTVPAGAFRAFRIACRNVRTGSMNYEMWYSPEVKQRIRERTYFSYGVRERELIAYKLR